MVDRAKKSATDENKATASIKAAPKPRRKRRKKSNGVLKTVLVATTSVIVTAAVFIVIMQLFILPGAQSRSTVDVQTLESQLSNISELATAEYLYTNSDVYTDSNVIGNFTLPFTTRAFIAKFKGSVKAGINLEDIDIEVNNKSHDVFVSLPEATILDTGDPEYLGVAYETSDIFVDLTNPLDADALNQLTEQNKASAKETAIESGLLELAQSNAEKSIEALFEGILPEGWTVTVETTGQETEDGQAASAERD